MQNCPEVRAAECRPFAMPALHAPFGALEGTVHGNPVFSDAPDAPELQPAARIPVAQDDTPPPLARVPVRIKAPRAAAGAITTFSVIWWTTYVLNFIAFTAVVLVQPWQGAPRIQALPIQILLPIAALLSNVLVADIVTDWACVWLSVIAETCFGSPPPPDGATLPPDAILQTLSASGRWPSGGSSDLRKAAASPASGGGAVAEATSTADEDSMPLPFSVPPADAGATNPLFERLRSDDAAAAVDAAAPPFKPPALPPPKRQVLPDDFLTIYCLKSKRRSDVQETLAFLHASRSMNVATDTLFCILSGTQDAVLAESERGAIAAFNARHRGRRAVRYVRRCRSVLFKYGQYLDFIMLLNGHRKPALYVDVPSGHASGDAFEPGPDVDFFLGSGYEFLVIMDRDNVLSPAFFEYAATLMDADPGIEIIQPEVRPFPQHFRAALHGGESVYTRLMSLFQQAGNDTQRHKKRFVNMAAFFGKGVIRRSAYNNKLLLYDPATGRSQEEVRVPRDLTSHDLIESCLMATTSTQQIYVYEDFPLSHVEWCQRQIRWDQGDLVIAKYIYPYTYGALANVASRFSYRQSIAVYAPETWEQRRVIYSSTFNIRCANGKLAIVALMALMAWVSVDTAPALYGLGAFLQAQMIVLPLLGLFAAVHSLSWWHKLVVQVMAIYIGSVDVWFGAFRALRALSRIALRRSRWNTFEALGMHPAAAAALFARGAALELFAAALVLAGVLWREWPLAALSAQAAFAITYLALVLTYPLFVFATSFKCGVYDAGAVSAPRIADTAQLPRAASQHSLAEQDAVVVQQRLSELKGTINEALDGLLLALRLVDGHVSVAKGGARTVRLDACTGGDTPLWDSCVTVSSSLGMRGGHSSMV